MKEDLLIALADALAASDTTQIKNSVQRNGSNTCQILGGALEVQRDAAIGLDFAFSDQHRQGYARRRLVLEQPASAGKALN